MKKKIKIIYNKIDFHKGQRITWADEKDAPYDMEILKRIIKGNIFMITNITLPKIPESVGHKQMLWFVCIDVKKNGEFIYSGAYFKPFIEVEDVKLDVKVAA